MTVNDKIIAMIKQRGPLLPVQISKEIHDDILMTSARLSELSSKREIKISSIKVGGSPLYYLSGQEEKLRDFSDNLHDVEKQAYELLQKNKILRDADQTPPIRVALRAIKDFAIPLQVEFNSTAEIFWKWYLSDNTEAHTTIKNILTPRDERTIPLPETKTTLTEEKTLQKPLLETKEPEKPNEKEGKTEEPIIQKPKKTHRTPSSDAFISSITHYFQSNKISVLNDSEIKKNTEHDFIVEIPSVIGTLTYFCKARQKMKINESDLSTAMVQANVKHLPLLFITNGGLTKKAQTMIDSDFKTIKFITI